jgi:hypothetical protein
MAGIDIQAKVKRGLRRAIEKTGSANSPLIYKVERTGSAGTPSSPGSLSTVDIVLVDSIFKSYDLSNIDQTFIKTGDRQLVTNGDVLIKENDIIKTEGRLFIVVSVDVKNPAGVPLAYIANIRPQ